MVLTGGRSMRAARALALGLNVVLACSCGGTRRSSSSSKYNPDVARYRLLLRDNPVDSAGALRCYGSCQSQTTPAEYLGCLAGCPGFEVKRGVACAPYETPPDAACITARRIPSQQEVDPAFKVVAVVAGVVLLVSLGVACPASSWSTCGAYYYYPSPGQRPAGL